VIEVRDSQYWKVLSPIFVTLTGITIEDKDLQNWKAHPSISVTLLGIIMEVRYLHPLKALFPILVTLLGIMVLWHPYINLFIDVSIIALHCSRLSYTVFPSATTMDVSESHDVKALFPILVTFPGITIDVSDEHSLKD
jgi:hypothetical protein